MLFFVKGIRMNKRVLLMGGLLLCTMQSTMAEFSWFNNKKRAMQYNERVRKFFSSYMASMLLSSGIGAFTGGLARYIEQEVVQYIEKKHYKDPSIILIALFFLSWHLEAEIRNDIVMGLQSDFDAYQVGYKKHLMFRNARIASWLTYLLLWDK